MKKLLLILLTLLQVSFVLAQNFPVRITPQAIPPYPTNLSGYANSGLINSPLRVQLVLSDITASSREVRLGLSIEGSNINATSAPVVIGAPTLILDAGIPLNLTIAELAPYFEIQNLQGISSVQYSNSLPDGSYRFCFEVFDAFNGNTLSSKSCVTIFLINNDPPFLNKPDNESKITEQNPTNIIFQWTPRHVNVPNVSYEFSIVEVWDRYIDPQAIFLSSPPLYQEVTTNTSLLYGPIQPLLLAGKRYAWRVRAFATNNGEEVSVFNNNGNSEIFWFDYQGNCQLPSNIQVQDVSMTNATISWLGHPDHLDYTIQYREAGSSRWYKKTTPRDYVTIDEFKPDTVYEYRVIGNCTENSFGESAVETFRTLSEELAEYASCGIEPDPVDLSNQELLTELYANDVFTAGDFPVYVKQVSGSGSFTGEGYISTPWLATVRIPVKFQNIKINTDMKLVDGFVITTYDPTWGSIADVDSLVEVVTGESDDVDGYQVDFDIAEVVNNGDGTVTVIGEDGQTFTTDIGEEITFTDINNDTWSVSGSGDVTENPGAEGGKPTATNTAGMGGNGVSTITAKGVQVVFEKGKGYYSFDALPNGATNKLKQQYEELPIEGGGNYVVPYKAISDLGSHKSDLITAKVTFSDNKITKEDIVFKTIAGSQIQANWDNSGTTATLSLQKKFDYAKEEILATVKPKDSGGQYTIAGTFSLMHLASQEVTNVNLKLISVNGANLSGIADRINEIYNPAGVRFNVSTATPISISDTTIDVGDSKLLTYYTDAEKAWINQFKAGGTYKKDTYYLFVTDVTPSDSGTQGFMPLKSQFGFIFAQNDKGRVAAHELGHGVFGLEHPFTEYDTQSGSTDLLMDYGTGTVLNHMDWEKMHAPGIQIYWFQGDEDGEFAGSYALSPDFQFVFIDGSSTLYVNSAKKKITGTLPGFIIRGKNDQPDTYYNWDFGKKKYVDKDNIEKSFPVTPENTIPHNSKLNLLYNLDAGCGRKGFVQLEYNDVSKYFRQITSKDLTAEQKANNVNALIAKYTKTKSRPIPCSSSNTSNYGWFEIPIDCSSTDIKELVQPEVDKINALVNENNIDIVVQTINDIKYKCVFNNVTNDILENLIEKLAKGSIKEQKERALVKVLIFVKKENAQDLFDLLNKEGNLNNIFKEVQNATFSLFGEQDNQDRLLQVLANKFKNLKEDSNKWTVINTLIKAKFNDIKDANKKEFMNALLASMKTYEKDINKIGGIVEFFSEMLIDDCKELDDYEMIFDLALLRLDNKEAFSSFTQGSRIKINIPGLTINGSCTINDSGVGRNWSWIKPGRFTLNCGPGSGLEFIESKYTEVLGDKVYRINDIFKWANYLFKNKHVKDLFSDNLTEYLKLFRNEFLKHIQDIKHQNLNFWETNDIVCNNLTKILNHININESSTSLKDVKKQIKLSLLEKYFDCSNNSISLSFEKIDISILKLLASFDKEDVSVLHTLEKIGIDKIHEKLEQDESFKTLAKVYVWMGGQAFNSNHYGKVDVDQILDKDGKIKNYSSVLSLESNMLQFKNFSASIQGKTKLKINDSGKSYDYNQMMVLYAADNFKFLDQNFKKGDVLIMPLIQAYAMSKSNRSIVAEKIAWTAVDGVLLFVGVGEFKILFTAGNYVRKAIVVSDLIGNAAGILGNILNESALSPQDRYNLQMLAIVASLPQLSTSIKGIDNMVSSLDTKINKLNNVSHKKALNDYFSEVKAKLPAASGLDDFIAILKQKKLFKKYDGLSDSLKKMFRDDFLTTSDEVLEALKNEDAFSTWKHFRGFNKVNIICN